MELIAKIGFFLAIAMFIGIGVGWFISDMMRKKSTLLEAKSLRSTIYTRDKQLKTLEDTLTVQKTQLYKMTDEGIVTRHKLLKQSNFIQKQSDELSMIQNKLGQVKIIERENDECLKHIVALNIEIKERDEILQSYEKEILLSKNIQEPFNPLDNEEIEMLNNKIKSLEKLLETMQPKLSSSEMIISKDQFNYIEQEFKELKEKIVLLEQDKKELMLLKKEESNIAIKKSFGSFFSSKKSNTQQYIDFHFNKQPKIKQV